MKQIVYVDLLFVRVILWNFCVLWLTNERNWRASGWKRILAGAAMNAAAYAGILFLPVPPAVRAVMELGGSLVMILISFPLRSFKSFLKAAGDFCICGMAWGGPIVLVLRGASASGFPIGGLKGMILEIMALPPAICFIRKARFGRETGGRAILKKGEKVTCVSTLVDTGNSLYEPIGGKPVCILDPWTAEMLWGEEDLFRVVPWHGVNNEKGILIAYMLPELKLLLGGPVKTVKNVCVAVSDGKRTQDGEQTLGGEWASDGGQTADRERTSDGTGLLIVHPGILER